MEMLEPLDSSVWTPELAAHLLNRAGFGGSPREMAALHQLGLKGAVGALLEAGDDSDLFPPPAGLVPRDLTEFRKRTANATPEEKKMLQVQMGRENRELMAELRLWWLSRMRWSPFAAREKATLFWHGHWATSIDKVKEPFAMWQQNETLRAFSLGRFEEMARAISRDPAMMRYLDLTQSKAGKPNENFARELMELFTLGEGHYTEADIQQSARAFTGYRINPKSQQFLFAKRQADAGEKSFFGLTGNFSGDDIIGFLAANPQCPRFLANKLWIFYAGNPPSDELLDALAAEYRRSSLDTGSFLRTVFQSREFYAPQVVRHQIKSPIQWLVQLTRQMEIPLPRDADGLLRNLGQVPFAPPNVKGWDGGRSWISSATLLARYNAAGTILASRPANLHPLLDPQKEDACSELIWRLFQSSLPVDLNKKFLAYAAEHGPSGRRDLVHLMMSTPDYQIT